MSILIIFPSSPHLVTMENSMRCFIFCAFFLILLIAVTDASGCGKRGSLPKKLFVFGDSYADTGNLGKIDNVTRCWYEPYGMSLPNRRPSGRFSDGKILTDFIASFLGIKSPIPYKYRKFDSRALSSGMNFAVSGTGVFDTGNSQRDLAAQIDTFKAQIDEGVFSKYQVESSVALVSVSGNDYMHYFEMGGNKTGIPAFTNNVTSQLKVEVKRIYELGVGKVVVTNLSPVYCTPFVTRDENYKRCDVKRRAGVRNHNLKLMRRVEELNRETKNHAFLLLDLHTAFLSIINDKVRGASAFKEIFKPCCEGKTKGSNCGQRDDKGVQQYSLCHSPKDYFYWDSLHPSQAGWAAVFRAIRPWLRAHLL